MSLGKINEKTLLALAFVAAFAVSGSGAQETAEEWFWNKPIASVQWEGIKKANRNELDALLRNYTGKPFTQDLWLEMQSKLYELDWFESIEPQALPVADSGSQLILRFVVKEKPSCSRSE